MNTRGAPAALILKILGVKIAVGLLVGSGVGLLVLFRSRRRWKDNLLTLALLYGSGVAAGLLIGALPLF